MSDDPLEREVSVAIHEALSKNSPGLVQAIRVLVERGENRERIQAVALRNFQSAEFRRWLETEIDYLIEEHQHAR